MGLPVPKVIAPFTAASNERGSTVSVEDAVVVVETLSLVGVGFVATAFGFGVGVVDTEVGLGAGAITDTETLPCQPESWFALEASRSNELPVALIVTVPVFIALNEIVPSRVADVIPPG